MRAGWTIRVAFLAVSAIILTPSRSAWALNTYSFVSSSGNNANSCFSPAPTGTPGEGPCATIDGALAKTEENGFITCIDARYYGGLDITKSVTIDCKEGAFGFNLQRITINAPGRNVRLRNIGINSLGSNSGPFGTPSIEIVAAGSVQIENVTVGGSAKAAILDRRTGPAKLFISNTDVLGNSQAGIVVAPQGGSTIAAVLDNVRVRDSQYGLAVGTGGRVMVKRSVFFGNFTGGVEADPGGIISIDDSLIAANATGIVASGGSSITIKNSSIDSNNTAISGATRSYGNNSLTANVSDGTAPTPVGGASSENGLK